MAVQKKGARRARRAPVAIEADQGHELLDLYIAELSRTPVLQAEAQKELARKMRNPKLSQPEKNQARAELISANLRFAFSVAKQYQNRGLSLEDLVGEANAGLCRAADKYDPDVGVNFISYAVWWIKQALHASITTKGRSVRLPLGRAGDLSRVVKAQAALRAALGREPTHDEIGRACNLSPEIAESLVALVQPERSLDEPLEAAPTPARAAAAHSPVSSATMMMTRVVCRVGWKTKIVGMRCVWRWSLCRLAIARCWCSTTVSRARSR